MNEYSIKPVVNITRKFTDSSINQNSIDNTIKREAALIAEKEIQRFGFSGLILLETYLDINVTQNQEAKGLRLSIGK